MPYLYLICTVFFSATASIFGTFFKNNSTNKKNASAFYNFLQLTSVFLGWAVLFLADSSFEVRVLPYSLAFGISFTACNFCFVLALKNGPSSLSTLFLNLSTILVSVWGCLFWKNPFTLNVGIGLVTAIIALVLCLYNGKNEQKISFKWLI